MKKFIHSACLLSMAFILVACPAKPKSRGSDVRVVVLGDPMKVIEGATLKPEINMDFFKDLKILVLTESFMFVQKQKYSLSSDGSHIMNEQAPPTAESDTKNSEVRLNVKIVHRTEGIKPSIELTADGETIVLTNERVDGKLFAYYKSAGDKDVVQAEVLHYSQTPDGQFMSLLTSHVDVESGVTLMAIYFRKDMDLEKRAVADTKYNYFYGAGIKTLWSKDKPVEISLCGKNAQSLIQMTESRASEWSEAMAPGQILKVKESQAEFFPMTDLNQQCLYYIDSYMVDPDPRLGIFGLTNMVAFNTPHFVDGDMLLFKQEFLKYDADKPEVISGTILHEIGHFLGLHHQFDGTASVMSYDNQYKSLTDYDKKAIQALYK